MLKKLFNSFFCLLFFLLLSGCSFFDVYSGKYGISIPGKGDYYCEYSKDFSLNCYKKEIEDGLSKK